MSVTDKWSRIPAAVLFAIADEWGLEIDDVPAMLVGRFGTTPSLRFVRDTWPILRDRWLAGDSEVLHRVADELRVFGVGKYHEPMADLDYLYTCSNARRLRDIVLSEILASRPDQLDSERAHASNPAADPASAAGVAVATTPPNGGDDIGGLPAQAPATAPVKRPTPDFTSQQPAWRELAAWAARERSQQDATDLWSISAELHAPPELTTTWQESLRVPLTTLADPDLLDADVDELMLDLVDSFTESRAVVLHQRILVERPQMLEAIGRQLGVSRERVRQIQRATTEVLDGLLQQRQMLPLRWRAADLAVALGGVAPAHHATTQAALQRATRGVALERSETAAALMLRLAGPYKLRGDWYERPGSQLPTSSDLNHLADANGLIPVTELSAWLDRQSIRPDFLDDVVAATGRFRRIGQSVARWASVVDKCAALLALRGAPADVETLIAETGETYSLTSTRNRLFENPQFMRTSRTAWALRSWGLEEYTGITDEIAQRIQEWGGKAKLSDLVDELVRQFGVSPGSVKVYADAPMFVHENGYVRLRDRGDLHELNADITDCRGLFLDNPGMISFRVIVDSELLRGSGRVCPEPLAACLGVTPDSYRLFAHGSGTVKVSWPKTSAFGPSLGSLRALAGEVGAAEGDLLRLTFDVTEETCAAARVVVNDLPAMELSDVVEALTGIRNAAAADLRPRLARAMGVAVEALMPTLQMRGESELMALLPADAPDEALQEALAGLADLFDSR